MGTELDQTRLAALHQAAHDLRGNAVASEVVERANVYLAYLSGEPEGPSLTDEQVAHMVSRFLSWKLPENFNPDGGISFKATFNENTDHPMRHDPSGTNLFDMRQATAMVRYMLAGLPPATPPKSDKPARERLYDMTTDTISGV